MAVKKGEKGESAAKERKMWEIVRILYLFGGWEMFLSSSDSKFALEANGWKRINSRM